MLKELPPVTLVIPTYNRAQLLIETIESALSQLQPFEEIIVVDDGSTDNTTKLLEKYIPRIRLISTVNLGVQHARNTGVTAAKTELVALCDSDDLLMSTYVELASGWMARHPETDIFYCNFNVFDENGIRYNKHSVAPANYFSGADLDGGVLFNIPDLYQRSIQFQPFFQSGVLFKKAFFYSIGGYNIAFKGLVSEDWEFTLRAIALGKLAVSTTPLAQVRKHSGNDSREAMLVNLGDAQVLEYALENHEKAKQYSSEIIASIGVRRVWAFDEAYARGNFILANSILKQVCTPPDDIRFSLKRLICKLPDPLRRFAWRVTQWPGATAAPRASSQSILVMEPRWDGATHMPGNLGMLRLIKEAYPAATLTFVGGAHQIEVMKSVAPADLLPLIDFVSWVPHEDKDPLPNAVWGARNRLNQLPSQVLKSADLIVLTSCTATMLSALSWMGFANKSCAVLHGNAGELAGWRATNPLRRTLDLTSALKRFCKKGGRAIVIEERILSNMRQQYAWLAKSLYCLPHPLLPEEARESDGSVALSLPIRIGFAGLATVAKGFPEFLELAIELHRRHPGKFDFRAIGMLHQECAKFDQSVLSVPAAKGLPRQEFVKALCDLHYIFAWHKDEYYGNAASGIVYDAVNLGIPLIARNRAQIADWHNQGIGVALSFETIDDAVKYMEYYDIALELKNYKNQCEKLKEIRTSLSINALSKQFRKIFVSSK